MEKAFKKINILAENVAGFPGGVKGPFEICVAYLR